MTIPVRVRSKVVTTWPGRLVSGDGITIDRSGVEAAFSFTPADFGQESSIPPVGDVLVYNDDDGTTSRLPIGTFIDLPLDELANDSDPSKGAALVGIEGTTVRKALGARTWAEVVTALQTTGKAMIAAGARIPINSTINLTSGVDGMPSSIEITGADPTSGFSFGPDGLLNIISFTNPKIDGLKCTGALTSETQWAEAISGSTISTAFDTVTYTDGSSTVSGSDFGHSKTDDVLTVDDTGLSAFTAYTRYVLSDFIELDPDKRYVINAAAGFSGGRGASAPVFYLYDDTDTLIGTHDPIDSSTFYHCIEGASSLKIAVGIIRHNHQATGLSCTYDFSKLTIYEATNEIATASLAQSIEITSHLFFSGCTAPTVTNNEFYLMGKAPIKFVNGSAPLFMGNRVTFCFGGITHQGCAGARYLHNEWDLRFRISGGGMLGQRLFRNHCISGNNCDDTFVAFNIMRGASWGYENTMNNASYTAQVCNNVIDCEMNGISQAHGGGTALKAPRVENNTITLPPFSTHGIEIPCGGYATKAICVNNTIDVADFALGTVGYAMSGSSISLDVEINGGYVRAPLGLTCLGSSLTGGLRVKGVIFTMAHSGVFSRAGSSVVEDCIFTLERDMMCFGTEPQASIRIEPPVGTVRQRAVRNAFCQTAVYAGLVDRATNLEFEDNRLPYGGVDYANRVGEFRFGIPASGVGAVTLLSIVRNRVEKTTVNPWTLTTTVPTLVAGSNVRCDDNILTNRRYNLIQDGSSGQLVLTAPNTNELSGSPEGVIVAPVGSRAFRTDGGSATTLYVKESGTGNTGWVGK